MCVTVENAFVLRYGIYANTQGEYTHHDNEKCMPLSTLGSVYDNNTPRDVSPPDAAGLMSCRRGKEQHVTMHDFLSGSLRISFRKDRSIHTSIDVTGHESWSVLPLEVVHKIVDLKR